jgi:hypothetical protein
MHNNEIEDNIPIHAVTRLQQEKMKQAASFNANLD